MKTGKAAKGSKKKRISHELSSEPLPLYYQIVNSLRSGIMMGDWPAGSRFPTEEELAHNYEVSRITVRRAKDILAKEKLIRSVQGSGCYVNSPEVWNSNPPPIANLNDVLKAGLKSSFKIHEAGMILNTPTIQGKLKNPGDRFIFQIRGVRYYHDLPISYVIYHFPFCFASKIPLEKLDENPLMPQLEKLAGIQVAEGIQNISLDKTDSLTAKHLGLHEGAPVLLVETVYFDPTMQPIEYVKTQYRDKLPYSFRVRRN